MMARYVYDVTDASNNERRTVAVTNKRLPQVCDSISSEFQLSGGITVQKQDDDDCWDNVVTDDDLPDHRAKLRFIPHGTSSRSSASSRSSNRRKPKQDQWSEKVELEKLRVHQQIELAKLSLDLEKKKLEGQDKESARSHERKMLRLTASEERAAREQAAAIREREEKMSFMNKICDRKLNMEDDHIAKRHEEVMCMFQHKAIEQRSQEDQFMRIHEQHREEIEARHKEAMAAIQFKAIELKERGRQFETAHANWAKVCENQAKQDAEFRNGSGVSGFLSRTFGTQPPAAALPPQPQFSMPSFDGFIPAFDSFGAFEKANPFLQLNAP